MNVVNENDENHGMIEGGHDSVEGKGGMKESGII